jgi:hypothetical protein
LHRFGDALSGDGRGLGQMFFTVARVVRAMALEMALRLPGV